MNDTKIKKMGRPLKFNKDQALASAINVFWSKGYEGSSMKDLTTAMGINAPSLYATFGDKHQLYLQAIDSYTSKDDCGPIVAFESESNIKEAIKSFFKTALEYATTNEDGIQGCFLSTCVSTSAGSIEGVQERLKQAIKETDIRLAARFEEEMSKGNLPKNFPSLKRAQLMFDLRQGYLLRARAGISIDEMNKDFEDKAEMVLGFCK
ncbi:TetR/AcrR family transcriptional regulator [Pseudocolwellia agarivorans]|uniref:TetR/AcrR family transcriptional regulator n=1 Tax=Pseudocolwellia agarivorans TaxID=1911682 RepID=UPI001C37D300|nr:TetR/AcrR family transcriptional regulator [Pseudocolwellia agarivorans]